MEPRYKKLASQLGMKINHAGNHMAHAAVGLIRRRRRKKQDLAGFNVGGSKIHPLKDTNPFPEEFI